MGQMASIKYAKLIRKLILDATSIRFPTLNLIVQSVEFTTKNVMLNNKIIWIIKFTALLTIIRYKR